MKKRRTEYKHVLVQSVRNGVIEISNTANMDRIMKHVGTALRDGGSVRMETYFCYPLKNLYHNPEDLTRMVRRIPMSVFLRTKPKHYDIRMKARITWLIK
jgi:hypothetical protein